MAWKLIWSHKAKEDRREILEYWKRHNATDAYCRKLNTMFKETSEFVQTYPESGTLTDIRGVRMRLIRTYKMFYQVFENEVVILRIWDSRRDPETFRL